MNYTDWISGCITLRIVGLIVRRMGWEVTLRHPLTDLQYAVVQSLDTEYESAVKMSNVYFKISR